MGDPKFSRRKYDTPSHPWQGPRIKEEKEIVLKYGLKNKTEVWKARSFLRDARQQARVLQGKQRLDLPQVKVETQGLLNRMRRLGLLGDEATLDDVLGLTLDAVLVRRLQTQAYLRGLAATPHQARQLIVHGHVTVDGGRVRVPGMLVTKAQENSLGYAPGSPLQNEQHPVRPKAEAVQALTATGGIMPERTRAHTPPSDRRGGRGGPGGRRGGPSGRGRGGGSKPKQRRPE
ncbi:MAG TPA: 30S ribosomal protein S4, partial [Candidatus Thermoplasmatota archaeon]|nr:30S ribosomal protein S4 [Candidatus Thermoplasmatota archaeon]